VSRDATPLSPTAPSSGPEDAKVFTIEAEEEDFSKLLSELQGSS
jgi:hypothetical protein